MFKATAKKLIDAAIKVTKKVTKIDEKVNTETGLTNKRLDAIFSTRGLSDMLLYRRFDRISIDDDMGIYEMADGRRGFIIQITPPQYLGNNTQKLFRHAIASLAKEGNTVHISTYASKNLDYEINRWKDIHHGNAKVDHPSVLKDWAETRANAYKKWTKKSMMRFTDVRLRNFITTVSVLLPYGVSDDEVIDYYRKAMAGFTNFSPTCFYPEDLMRMYNEMFRPNDESWEAIYDPNMPLNHQIGLNTKINVTPKDRERGTITIDSTMKMKTLTTARMPKHISLSQYQQLFYDIYGDDIAIPLPSSYLVSMTIAAIDLEKIADNAVDKAVGDQDTLRRLGIKDVSKNPHFGDRYTECVETVSAIKEKGERLYKTMYQIFIFEEDEAKLDRHSKALIERFKLSENGGWTLEAEKHPVVAINTLLYSLPLMYLDFMREHHLKHRFFQRWTSNNAATAPIVADSKGIGDFTNLAIGRTGQAIRIDWRAESNQNIIIIGPMGTGKSFLLNELLMSSVSQGIRVRAFDLGGSSKSTCQNVGGKHIEFDIDQDICMNFFTNIIEIDDQDYFDEEKNCVVKGSIVHPEEYSTIIPMIGLMCKQDLKSSFQEYADDNALRQDLSTYIQRAVELAHRARGKEAGMREVVEVLKEIRQQNMTGGLSTKNVDILISGLYNYGNQNGMYYRYFNGANNIDISEYDLAVFEFEKLKNMGDLLYVAQAGIMQKIAVEFFYNRDIPKMFSIDEAKIMALDNVVMISYLEDFALRLRKYGAIFSQATQASSHYQNSHPKAREMYSLAAWKVFLPRDETAIATDIASGAIVIGPFQRRIMESLKFNPPDYSEFYLMGTKMSVVCRLKVDPLSYWLYTTSPSDNRKITQTSTQTGLDRIGSIYYLAKTMDGVSHEEALDYAMKRSNKTSQNSLEPLESGAA